MDSKRKITVTEPTKGKVIVKGPSKRGQIRIEKDTGEPKDLSEVLLPKRKRKPRRSFDTSVKSRRRNIR